MAYIVWKVVKGQGPYAYLRESVRLDGRVATRHLGYLGRLEGSPGGEPGEKTVLPGSVVRAPSGQEVVVPEPGPALMRRLGTTAPARGGAELGTTRDGELGTTGQGHAPTGREAELGTTAPVELPTTSGDELGTTRDGELGTTPEELELSGTDVMPPATVRPQRLADGTWGVWSDRELSVGETVRVVTASGQEWETRVTELMEQDARGTVAKTQGRPPRRPR